MNFLQAHFKLIKLVKDSEPQHGADTEYWAYLIDFVPTNQILVPNLLGFIPYIF